MDLAVLYRLLLYGGPETRRRAVGDLLKGGDASAWRVLVNTVNSASPWQLRVRCLEALGNAAASADESTARDILTCITPAAAFASGEAYRVELSPRERQIALLVAAGLSNRAIAGELGITSGTVNIHVEHILSKLGVRNRAAIGAWVGQHRTT